MAVSENELRSVKRQAIHEASQRQYAETLNAVFDVLEGVPPKVWCAVGEAIADEGGYQILLERECVNNDNSNSDGRHNTVFKNKLQPTKDSITLSKEV